ncbi:DUF1295 domain-containing protein [Balamuthia mandrillaris]
MVVIEWPYLAATALLASVEFSLVWALSTFWAETSFVQSAIALNKGFLSLCHLDENNPYFQVLGVMLLLGCLVFWVLGRLTGADWAFDPHWSLHGMLCVIFYQHHPALLGGFNSARSNLLLLFFALYAVELTYHYFQVSHFCFWKEEDWRYTRFRKALTGYGYWLWSLFMVYVLQAAMIFPYGAGIYGVHVSNAPLNWVDGVACLSFVISLFLQTVGDYQMFIFRKKRDEAKKQGKPFPVNLETGLWYYSRHPAYVGEWGIWFSAYLFSVAAGGPWWAIVGPILCLLAFAASIPLTEKRVMVWNTTPERQAAYAKYQRTTSAFFPWFKFRDPQEKAKKQQ